MLASYSFNTSYQPNSESNTMLPSLRLLEGGKFYHDQFSPVLVQEYSQVRLRFFRWGLIPAWHKVSNSENPLYTTPIQHVLGQTQLQIPARRQRCLIPADGYYIEKMEGSNTQIHKIAQDNLHTFCFAGLYDMWKAGDGTLQYSFTILTKPSTADMRHLNLQMPLILSKRSEALWINPHTNLSLIEKLLHSNNHSPLEIRAVHELAAA